MGHSKSRDSKINSFFLLLLLRATILKRLICFATYPGGPKKDCHFAKKKNTAGDIALQAGNKKTMCLNMDRGHSNDDRK